MMVIAMMMAATTQATAIQAPPSRIQRMFRAMETGGIGFPFEIMTGVRAGGSPYIGLQGRTR